MKKLIFLFALLFSISTSFVSCRDTEEADDVDDMELNEELEEEAEEIEDEY
ncbi:hypothetical protein ACXYMT_00785 [Salinimicrobium sp. CAU 1759]|uniref:hypothetical protein n=1 Tax=Salinimicrobium sp. HB62 TaxID=3077781 RepID=UPI002D78F020|nr:hypothetical protein [Salinimicrobium sp. HB62]